MPETRIIQAAESETSDTVREPCALLRAVKIVALPTETVYGLGAVALNPAIPRMGDWRELATCASAGKTSHDSHQLRQLIQTVKTQKHAQIDTCGSWHQHVFELIESYEQLKLRGH